MSSPPALDLHPDRLLPSEPGLRSIARQLYQAVADLPIISHHCHVPAKWLADETAFADPTSLLITDDGALETIHDLVVTNPRKAFRL